VTRSRPGSTGEVHFSMKVFLENKQGIDNALETGPYQERALVPASPWLGTGIPSTPWVNVEKSEDGKWVLTMKSGDNRIVRFFTIRVKTDHWLMPRVTSDQMLTLGLDADANPTEVSVTAVDRVGNESKARIIPLKSTYSRR